jgi:hypothetical protein
MALLWGAVPHWAAFYQSSSQGCHPWKVTEPKWRAIVDPVDHAEHIREQALSIAVVAGAVQPCHFHPDVTITLGDEEAERRAYAMVTNQWTKDDMGVERAEFMDAIKDAIESADDECYRCARLRDG